MGADFEIVGSIEHVEVIAKGKRIHELPRLNRTYGKGPWRKLKGLAWVRLADDALIRAELHWYELSYLGKKEIKIKRLIET